MCFSRLVSLADEAVMKHASDKKKHPDESTKIHEAISKASTKDSYDSSKIHELVNSYSEEKKSSNKRRL
ncbi:MAG TPA: hypothetical protein VL360_05110 [Gammaproteobacteria bacterium]|nr:hypothetical protein [Gammaproteobacteria bacterium]